MKRWVALLVVVLAVFAVYNRNRLFVRDPLGSVTRGGEKEDGAQVFINYSNEGLIENDNPPMYLTVIQHGGRIGEPAKIHCLHYLVCLMDEDQATLVARLSRDSVESMEAKSIRYRSNGEEVVVTLR